MTDPDPTTPVSVALIATPAGEHLWVWDAAWGTFALPMARAKENEPPAHAAARAAAEALGVPVRVGKRARLEPELFASGRDAAARRYRYDVFRAEPHPDFTPRPPGAHLWLAPHRALAREYAPLSPSARWVVAALALDGLIPGRSQATGVVVLTRWNRGIREFLLRHEPGWGYGLPTKRRAAGQSYAAVAARVLTDELGLAPGTVALTAGKEAVVTARDCSRAEGVATFYLHGVFEADAPAGLAVRSARPVVWADADTILGGAVRDRATPDGNRAPDDAVSPTVAHVLQELDRLPTVVLA